MKTKTIIEEVVPEDPAIARIRKKCDKAKRDLKLYTWKRDRKKSGEDTYIQELHVYKRSK